MEIMDRFVEDCVVIDMTEERFEYPKTIVLKNHALKLLQEGHNHFVLNMSDVQNLDSFGIAVIVSILKHCREANGNLTLFGLNEQVQRLIELTHMDRVLDIWPSESQAVAQVRVKASK
jgi:anti-sigma B factor antagonist